MIGILLFWLAFAPVQPVPGKSAVPRQEQLHRQKDSAAGTEKRVLSNPVAEILRCQFDRMRQQKDPAYGIERQTFISQLARFYAARGYQPVWTNRAMVSALIGAVEEAANDGLEPSDYHIREIRGFYGQPPATPELQARYDLLMSDAFLTLASHLRYGKVDPVSLDPNWNLSNNISRSALEYRLQSALAAERIAAVLQELRPQHPEYDRLRKGLARYRLIAREGGWQALTEGAAFKEGLRDVRVPMLRQRLEASGDLAFQKKDSSTVYSREMTNAVKRFQKRNGMDVDGVVGAATLRIMNVPVEQRIDQLRINLERYRWFFSDLGPTYIMVNIADFTLKYVENGRQRWSTRVIVGKPYRETPVFKADMQYIVFNPQWVIPPTILEKDALPAIRKSTSYLARKKLKVIDRDGRVVDPASVSWSQYSGANLPYRLQQTAGDHGSLGRVKFMLPNVHIVYLHDTPTKDLFEKSTRTFSSGCIRVENPLDLAGLVLQDSVKWSGERIRAAVNTGKTTTVFLPKRIPVFILYMTAVANGDEILFREDVYNRDKTVLKALVKPVPEYKTQSCGL